MKILCIASLLILLSCAAVCQDQAKVTPEWKYRFEDFRVDQFFHGKPTRAKIVTKFDRQFRTRIRKGALEGPNFSDHYTIVSWGCGSDCVSFVIVDATNGKVSWNTPFRILLVPYHGSQSGKEYRGLEFKRDSRLLVADGCPDENDCGTHYFEWVKGNFQKIGFEPNPAAER